MIYKLYAIFVSPIIGRATMGKLEQQLLAQVLEFAGGDERRIPNVVYSVVEGAHIDNDRRRHEMRCLLEKRARETLREEVKKKSSK